jgi:hypothetical protein
LGGLGAGAAAAGDLLTGATAGIAPAVGDAAAGLGSVAAAAPGAASTVGSLAAGGGLSAAGAAVPASVASDVGDAVTLISSDTGAAAGAYTPGITAADAFAQGGGAVTAGPLGGASGITDAAAFDATGGGTLGSTAPGSVLTGAVGGGSPAVGGSSLATGIADQAGSGFVDSGSFDAAGGSAGSAAAGATNGLGSAANGVGHFLGNNASWLLPAGVLGYDFLKSSEGLGNIPGYNQLNSEAQSLAQQGTQLQSYLQTGTLPPGVSQSLQQAATAAQATIRSQYAARGMSGSSAEATDLENVQNQIAGQGAQIAMQLLDTGISESNLSSQLYASIMNANLQQDQLLGNALTTFASAAARPTVTLNTTSSNS